MVQKLPLPMPMPVAISNKIICQKVAESIKNYITLKTICHDITPNLLYYKHFIKYPYISIVIEMNNYKIVVAMVVIVMYKIAHKQNEQRKKPRKTKDENGKNEKNISRSCNSDNCGNNLFLCLCKLSEKSV